jgi:hypothetical protein
MRAVVSVPPPGSKPTTVVMAFCGHCAKTLALNASPTMQDSILIFISL